MANTAVAGINIAIGADLSDLKQEMGQVGTVIENGIKPGQKPVQDLADNTKKASTAAGTAKVNFQAIASAVERIGSAIIGWGKGMLDEAIKVNPSTAAAVDGIKDSFERMKSAVADSLSPAIQEAAPIITGLFDTITTWAKDNPETAKTVIEIAGGIGALASAAGAAAPFLLLFDVSLAPIAGTALAVAGSIAGVVAIVVLLQGALEEASKKAEETSEHLASLNTASEGASFNNLTQEWEFSDHVYVPVEFVDENGETVTKEARLDETQWNTETNAQGVWITKEQDLADAASSVTESLTEQTEAMDTVAESTEETKSAAEQALEIYEQMQQSVAGTTETMAGDGGLSDALTQVSDIIGSDAFRQLSSQPISEDVNASWSAFSGSINSATDSFSTLESTLNQGSAADKIADIGAEAATAAASFGAMADMINSVIAAVKELNRLNMPTLGSGGGTTGGGSDVFKAGGGPVRAGHAYVVGEFEPEFFIPDQDGEIVPMSRVNNSTNNYNFGNVYGEGYLRKFVAGIVSGVIRKELRRAA
ncbi:MAG: hypothetical protein II974_10915 [Firmicutes bacterium]|nr:hypothetical protein [Bacillota bacterium]